MPASGSNRFSGGEGCADLCPVYVSAAGARFMRGLGYAAGSLGRRLRRARIVRALTFVAGATTTWLCFGSSFRSKRLVTPIQKRTLKRTSRAICSEPIVQRGQNLL